LLLEGSFLKIGFFVRPGENVCYFDLSFFIDEDVVGSDITNFFVNGVEISRTADQTVKKIPQLFLLKVFVHADPVINLLFK
jgi:hypothetical protein